MFHCMSHATVCLSYDFDAVSLWLHSFGALDSPTEHSRGVYGAEVGAPRVLDLHDRLDLPATWFIPGHTIESFPDISGEVWERGYDIQHHGYTHTNPASFESKDDERADIERAIDSIADLTGREPTGYRSPAWDFSDHTLDIIQDLGFEWDSSQMGNDFSPYYLHEGWEAPVNDPYDPGTETDILEFPVSWDRDDFPPLSFVWGETILPGFADESSLFGMWKDQFDWMYEHLEHGVYLLTMHPQVIGQPPRIARLEALITHMQAKPGVEFATIDEVAMAHKAGDREAPKAKAVPAD